MLWRFCMSGLAASASLRGAIGVAVLFSAGLVLVLDVESPLLAEAFAVSGLSSFNQSGSGRALCRAPCSRCPIAMLLSIA